MGSISTTTGFASSRVQSHLGHSANDTGCEAGHHALCRRTALASQIGDEDGGSTRIREPGYRQAGGVAYQRMGRGEPLVLLHGFGGSGRIWRPVLPFLLAHRDVIAVDLPGFGASAPLPARSPHTPDQLAAAVERLLDALDLDAPQVAGHSLGAWVALELALRGRAGSVTAVCPAGLWPTSAPHRVRRRLLRNRFLALACARAVPYLLGTPSGRRLLLSGSSARPADVPPGDRDQRRRRCRGRRRLPAGLSRSGRRPDHRRSRPRCPGPRLARRSGPTPAAGREPMRRRAAAAHHMGPAAGQRSHRDVGRPGPSRSSDSGLGKEVIKVAALGSMLHVPRP